MICATGEACGEPHAAGKCPWVLVKDAYSVREGDALRWSDIGPEISIVLGLLDGPPCLTCGGMAPGTRLSDDPQSMIDDDEANCVECDVSRGVLFKLVLPPPDSSETDETQRPATKPRRLTTTNAGGKR